MTFKEYNSLVHHKPKLFSDASTDAAAIISAVGDAPSIPAPVVQVELDVYEESSEITSEHKMKHTNGR